MLSFDSSGKLFELDLEMTKEAIRNLNVFHFTQYYIPGSLYHVIRCLIQHDTTASKATYIVSNLTYESGLFSLAYELKCKQMMQLFQYH